MKKQISVVPFAGSSIFSVKGGISMKPVNRRSSGRLSVALAALSALFAGSAHATGVPVVDSLHVGINKMAWVQQYGQLYTDYQNQMSQIQNQYQQIQSQIQDIREQQVNGLKIESPLGQRLPLPARRGANDFVDERCGSLGGGGLARLFEGGVGGSQRVVDARSRQFAACVLLVREENARFNYMIEYHEKLREIDQDLMRLQAETNSTSGNERGRLERNTNSWSNLSTKQVAEIQAASAQLNNYEQRINILKAEMAQAGRTAFSNKSSSLLGQAIQYGTLRGALEIARARER